MSNTSSSPWAALLNTRSENEAASSTTGYTTRVVKSKNPAINGSFDEPVRKGRKPEVSKTHQAVIDCRKLYQDQVPLHRIAIEVGVDYAILARWFDKGWMEIPRKRRGSI